MSQISLFAISDNTAAASRFTRTLLCQPLLVTRVLPIRHGCYILWTSVALGDRNSQQKRHVARTRNGANNDFSQLSRKNSPCAEVICHLCTTAAMIVMFKAWKEMEGSLEPSLRPDKSLHRVTNSVKVVSIMPRSEIWCSHRWELSRLADNLFVKAARMRGIRPI